MIKSSRRVFVVGGHITKFIGARHPDFIHKKHPDFGKKENPDLEYYVDASVNKTLEATGVQAEVIDKAWIGNFAGELFSKQGHLGAAVVGSNPGLMYKPVMRVEGACASGGLAFASAVDAIKAGCDVTLAVGAEVQTTTSARQGGEYLARASHFKRQSSIDDFVFPAMFARRIKGCLEVGAITAHDLAILSVKAYSNANKNPLAHMHHAEMTLENALTASDANPNFLGNPELSPFLKVSDCSQVSDGGAGVIVCSEEGLKKLNKRPEDCIELIGLGHATGNLYADSHPAEMDTTAYAARVAFQDAEIQPLDLEVAEVHDCFTISEVLMMEAIGYASKGRGHRLVRAGDLEINGRIPVNTGGGLVGFGHPVGATGIKQVLEIYRQMKNQCGEYQIPDIPAFGLAANMGGDDKTSVVSIFKNL